MTINEFAKKVCDEIAEILNEEIVLQEVNKLNGVKLHALIMTHAESTLKPTLYLESFYQKYMESENWSDIIQEIIDYYQALPLNKHIDMEWIKDFHKVQELVFHKLINYDANTELLKDIPHSRYLDFAIVYCVYFENDETGNGSILIRNEHLEMWHCKAQDLSRLAEENTPRLFPLSVSTMSDIFQIDTKKLPPIVLDAFNNSYRMSNSEKINGAITIRYKDSLKNFAQQINSDVVIVPCSVHEVILRPLNADTDLNDLKATVYQINRSEVAREEFLSDHVYLYRRDTDSIEIVP